MAKSFLIFSLLVLALYVIHVSSNGVLYIACGTSASFVDPNGNQWVGDYQFIQSGYPASVLFTSSEAPFLTTVRYFPSGSINCYRIPGVTQGAAIRVDAIFHYGNYDSRSLPPTFGLQIDGSNWATVETYVDPIMYTRTYVAVANTVSVCLASGSLGYTPFISAIRIMQADTSTSSGNSNPGSGSDTGPSKGSFSISDPTPVAPKDKAHGLLYLLTLCPTPVVAGVIYGIIRSIKKKKQAEVQAGGDANVAQK